MWRAFTIRVSLLICRGTQQLAGKHLNLRQYFHSRVKTSNNEKAKDLNPGPFLRCLVVSFRPLAKKQIVLSAL